jgi:hypothetical protein
MDASAINRNDVFDKRSMKLAGSSGAANVQSVSVTSFDSIGFRYFTANMDIRFPAKKVRYVVVSTRRPRHAPRVPDSTP